jgi:hypothetical protein
MKGSVSREDFKCGWKHGAQLAHALDGSACFFDGDDVWMFLCEGNHGLHSDFNAAASGDAVEHDWKLGGLGDRRVMGEKASLCGLVVIGGDDQCGVRSNAFGFRG